MKTFFYDLHVHSCLSPCGDDEMTVANIAGMSYIKELGLVALTDHNTAKNAPAFFEACENYGIVPVAGVEVTTAEEIHLLCLFPTLDDAMRFDGKLSEYRLKIKNKPEIFGEQLIVNVDDEVVGRDEYLLPVATMLSLEDAVALADSFGAAYMPAHIDRPSNGILAILGTLPESPEFGYVELRDREARDRCGVGERHVIVNSDAHRLEDINEPENTLKLDVPEDAGHDEIRRALIRLLRGEA